MLLEKESTKNSKGSANGNNLSFYVPSMRRILSSHKTIMVVHVSAF